MNLLNLHDYTPTQLALYSTGAYLWVVAYIIYVRNGFKYKVVEMPAFAAAGNIGWELNWALFFTTDLGALCVYAHKAWFFIDVAIFFLVLKYGYKQTDVPWLTKHWIAACSFVAVCAAFFYGTMVKQGFDVGSTIQSAYVCQLPISFLYIPLMLKQKSLVGYSMWTAWTRTLGTGFIGVFAFMRYPDHPWLLSMAVISTVVDFIYIWLFARRRRELAMVTA
ncbi:MAG: hypothetical protein ACHQQ3_06500 [Gemmatimonadales bacterium]